MRQILLISIIISLVVPVFSCDILYHKDAYLYDFDQNKINLTNLSTLYGGFNYLNSSQNYSIFILENDTFYQSLGSRDVFLFPENNENELLSITIKQNNNTIFEGYVKYEKIERPSKLMKTLGHYSLFGSIILVLVSLVIYLPYVIYTKLFKKEKISKKVSLKLLIIIILLTIIATSIIANMFNYSCM